MGVFFGWLDYSEKEKRRMLNVIRLFEQRDTRDEMGRTGSVLSFILSSSRNFQEGQVEGEFAGCAGCKRTHAVSNRMGGDPI